MHCFRDSHGALQTVRRIASYTRLASRSRTVVLFLSRPSFDRHFRFADVTTLAQVYPQADFVFMVYKGQIVLGEIDFYFEFYGAPCVSSGSAVWRRQKPCLCVYQFFTALNATTSLSTFHSNTLPVLSGKHPTSSSSVVEPLETNVLFSHVLV